MRQKSAQLQTTNIQHNNPQIIPKKLGLKIFPNPTNSQSVINFNIMEANNIKLSLFDVTGREIFRESLGVGNIGEKKKYVIDLTNYPSGVYFIAVENGNFREVKKLMLSR